MKKKKKISILLIIIIFSVFFFIKYIGNKVNPVIMEYAKTEAKEISSIIVNKSISKHVTEDLNVTELFIVEKKNDEIETIDFNPVMVNKFLTEVTTSIQTNLKSVHNGNVDSADLPDNVIVDYNSNSNGIVFKVPMGLIFENAVLSNIGPKIPIKLNLIGEANSAISTKVTNYGINNALIEVYVNINVEQMLIIPFSKEKIKFNSKVPVALKLIKGTVPKYYANGIDSNSNQLVVPVE